jgi:hypothetical protein
LKETYNVIIKIKAQSGFKWDDEKGADIDESTAAVWEAFEMVCYIFSIDNRDIDNHINRNTKAGSGSRKSSRSCQPPLAARMFIVRHRDLSCPLNLKLRNSNKLNLKPTHRTLNGLSLNGYVILLYIF